MTVGGGNRSGQASVVGGDAELEQGAFRLEDTAACRANVRRGHRKMADRLGFGLQSLHVGSEVRS